LNNNMESPIFTIGNEENLGREITNDNDNVFPQMTTIGNVDYYEDGSVMLSEEQRLHFNKNRMLGNYELKGGDGNSSNQSRILENLEEED
jgi:hypothetical protein